MINWTDIETPVYPKVHVNNVSKTVEGTINNATKVRNRRFVKFTKNNHQIHTRKERTKKRVICCIGSLVDSWRFENQWTAFQSMNRTTVHPPNSTKKEIKNDINTCPSPINSWISFLVQCVMYLQWVPYHVTWHHLLWHHMVIWLKYQMFKYQNIKYLHSSIASTLPLLVWVCWWLQCSLLRVLAVPSFPDVIGSPYWSSHSSSLYSSPLHSDSVPSSGPSSPSHSVLSRIVSYLWLAICPQSGEWIHHSDTIQIPVHFS